MKFNKKGQGALEYLLLIGGAVLIAVIVIALLVGMGSSSNKDAAQGGERINQTISGTAVASVLRSANCTPDKNLSISYTHNGGDVNLVVDGVVKNYRLDSNVSNKLIVYDSTVGDLNACDVVNKQYKISLQTTSTSGATAMSNSIFVTGK